MDLKEKLPILLAGEVNHLLGQISLPATLKIFLNSTTKSLLSTSLTDAQAWRIREEILQFAQRVYMLEPDPIPIQVIEEKVTNALPAADA